MRSLTFAVALEADRGVVIVCWSNRFSRMYRWNLKDDSIVAGQFLKAGAKVLDISPDATYVVYLAEKMGHIPEAYIAVSHPPYFTALACFQDHHRHWHYGRFVGERELHLGVRDAHGHWAESFPEQGRRIDPGCPLQIEILPETDLHLPRLWIADEKRNRKLWTCRNRICTSPLDNDEQKPLLEFHREEFVPILAPEWARRW